MAFYSGKFVYELYFGPIWPQDPMFGGVIGYRLSNLHVYECRNEYLWAMKWQLLDKQHRAEMSIPQGSNENSTRTR